MKMVIHSVRLLFMFIIVASNKLIFAFKRHMPVTMGVGVVKVVETRKA